MRVQTGLHILHLIVLSSRALTPDTRTEEYFCFRIKSQVGRTECSFLRSPGAAGSVLFYWSIWTAEGRVEDCSISTDTALIQHYMTGCQMSDTRNVNKMSLLFLNMTVLWGYGSPCEFQPIVHSDLMWYLDPVYRLGSGTRRRQKRAWLFPGTLWCGQGSRAGYYEQLGMFDRVDRCCRDHDHCDYNIRPFTVNFGVFNPTFFTVSHCDCDRRFKQCLLDINDTISNMVGYTFFNIFKIQCFELIQKRICTNINWIGMCTSDKIAPYAALKYSAIYNATSKASIPEPQVDHRQPSTNTKQKNMKLKEAKQLTSQKKYILGPSAAVHQFLLSETVGQPFGKPKTVSAMTTTVQPNCLMNCNTTLFNQKSKLINQNSQFPSMASIADVHTSSIATTKLMTNPLKNVSSNKCKNITQWPITTVQTKLVRRYKPLTSKLNGDPPKGDHFQPKQQREAYGKQDNVSLHITVSTNFTTFSLASKESWSPKGKNKSISQTKKEANCLSQKNTSRSVLSGSRTQNSSTSEIKHKSSNVTNLPKPWKNTNSTHETFMPTAICDATRHLDNCRYKIRPMTKSYGLQNTGTATIYHCDCIHRLTDHLRKLKSIALLKKFLWKFVSMSCIEILNKKECNNNTRWYAILSKATELESLLIKLEGRVTVKNRKISTNKRVSKQLYKRCLWILHPRRPKHLKHNV